MHLALYQPAIPNNTGNIGRLCVGLDATLHLIGPCGFDLSDHAVRRAGLDYWPMLRWNLYESPETFLEWLGERTPWLVTKTGVLRFDQPTFVEDDVLILGNEQRGLPEDWRARWESRTLRIPLLGPIRSFNLANAASIVLAHAKLKSGAMDR